MALSSLSSVKTKSCLLCGKCTCELIKIAKNWQIPPNNFTANPLDLYFLILFQVFLFCESRHLGPMANTDSNTDRRRCFLSYQCISFTHLQVFYSNSSILWISPMPLFLLIIYIAAMLRVVLGFQFIYTHTHTHTAKWHYSMRQNGLLHGKTSQAQHILQCLMSATQKFMSGLKCYLCKMSVSVMTGKDSPLQGPDKRSWI